MSRNKSLSCGCAEESFFFELIENCRPAAGVRRQRYEHRFRDAFVNYNVIGLAFSRMVPWDRSVDLTVNDIYDLLIENNLEEYVA